MNAITETKAFFTTSELKRLGYSYYKIGVLERDGILRRINRSTYENLSYRGDEHDFFRAAAYVPSGVICLMSAARYHELTNFLPDAVAVAIERKKKVSTLPEWPKVRLYYFDSLRMSTGVQGIHIGGNHFHIFDIEKTVVDILYYRNKVGIEETSEILHQYLRRPDRQIDRLYTYSRLLRCENILRTYLEVLL